MPDSTTSPPGTLSPTDPAIADLIGQWVDASGPDHAGAIAAVVQTVARASSVDVSLRLGAEPVPPDLAVARVSAEPALLRRHGPWLAGFVREALLAGPARRAQGVHHTPPVVAATVVSAAFDAWDGDGPPLVADPAVGGGAFLLAVGEHLGGNRAERLDSLTGCDIDPLAVAVTRAGLELWAGGAHVPEGALTVADFRTDPAALARRPDLVVGNPPFLSQLRGAAVRDEGARDALRDRWSGVGGYLDAAAEFLLAALDAVDDGAVIALIQPASFLSARDAGPVRDRLAATAPLAALWIDGQRQFAAGVDTIAVVARRGAAPGPVRRYVGAPAETLAAAPPPDGTWAPLLADVTGIPSLDPAQLASAGSLGAVAEITAGFRDEYYGLREAVRDDPDGECHLVTSGLIDPLHSLWGARPARFDRRRWSHPVVDPDRADAAIRAWLHARRVPKALVATQTKVLEVVVDAGGTWIPSTPVVSVEPVSGAPSLWHLAAALTSPVAAALVATDMAGSALSRDAMRVSAARLKSVPLPAPGPDWDAAAEAAAAMQRAPSRARLRTVARLAMAAYGCEHRSDLLGWWEGRLPRARPG